MNYATFTIWTAIWWWSYIPVCVLTTPWKWWLSYPLFGIEGWLMLPYTLWSAHRAYRAYRASKAQAESDRVIAELQERMQRVIETEFADQLRRFREQRERERWRT